MEWLSENWLLVLFGGGMIAMHLGGHRHGGSGGGGGCCGGGAKKNETSETKMEQPAKLPPPE